MLKIEKKSLEVILKARLIKQFIMDTRSTRSNNSSDSSEKRKFEQTYVLNVRNKLIHARDIENLMNGLFGKINKRRKHYGSKQQFATRFRVNDIEMYRRAFTHKSFVDEQTNLANEGKMQTLLSFKQQVLQNPHVDFSQYVLPDNIDACSLAETIREGRDTIGYNPVESFERLEYLGDGIIKSCQGTYLFNRFPGKPGQNNEGFLTKLRIKLEQTKRLAEFAKHLGFDKWLLFSDYLEKLGHKEQGRNNQKALENVFEAFVGAIIQDNQIGIGYTYAYNFMAAVMEECVNFSKLIAENDNFKDSLLRWFAKQKVQHPKNSAGKCTPFDEVYHEGPPNNRTFIMSICVSKDFYNTLSSDLKSKITSYNHMMFQMIQKKSPIDGVNKWNEILKSGRIPIGIGKERSKIKSEQLSSKKALLNLNIPLNF